MQRVAGNDSSEWFEESGRMTLADFERALAHVGKTLGGHETIYDFGCGCGRLTRLLPPDAEIIASDIDREAVEWMKGALPHVNAFRNDWLPPLGLDDASVDLTLAWSVFTHLPEDLQDLWLQELRRVSKPSATLLVSVHGERNWNWTLEQPFGPGVEDAVGATLAARGFAYYTSDGQDPAFPDFYHTSWHHPQYIRNRWSQWFDVIDVLEAAGFRGPKAHDIVILRRRADPLTRD